MLKGKPRLSHPFPAFYFLGERTQRFLRMRTKAVGSETTVVKRI